MDTLSPAPALAPSDAQPPASADSVAPSADAQGKILAPPAPVPACVNCGVARAGRFCADCGQPATDGRLTVRGVAANVFSSVVDVDRGLLHTVVGLTVRPGQVVRDYLGGRTVPYTGPGRYFAILVTLVVLVYVQGGPAAELARLSGASGQAGALQFLQTHMNLLIAVNVPFSALATRVVYRRSGLNYAEHIVYNLYTAAHQSLLLIPFAVAGVLFHSLPLMMGGYSVGSFLYLSWAAAGMFRVSAMRAVLLTLLSQAVMMVVALALGVVIGAAYAAATL
ncbi:MAG TPA: DUF3667 domain-containing protein [Longimicrobium sp.]|jgi:hypothetical protein|uniref:DUF3667 domain-containing protein n=1 Tax=Longimicrobium sp. TaxID=2029185 RepID=UPI002EDB2476